MKFGDLHECLEPLGMSDLADALLRCGLVEAVQGFHVMRTDVHTYIVLPILQGQLKPGRDCQPSAVFSSGGLPLGLAAPPVEKQGPLGPQLPSSRQKEPGDPDDDGFGESPWPRSH